MFRKRPMIFLGLLLIMLLALSACAPAAPADSGGGEDAASEEGSSEEGSGEESTGGGAGEMPEVVDGKFNVAFVYVGPIGDGGWTYAHNEGRVYLEEALGDEVNTAYLESVPEGADAERVIRNLARAGFNAIFTTSFGYMDATEAVAEEFPDSYFVHVSGFKKNESNFSNLFGAMENMKYLAGMIAGARAAADGSNRVGYIAPFPIPEVIRHANATSLGMLETCPDCEMDLRWIFTWFDPDLERQAAQSLIEAGAGVVITGADTPGPVQVAGEQGLYGIGYDSANACEVDPEHCLTTPYWNWGQSYTDLVESMIAGEFVGEDVYFDADSGALGLLGFMEGEEVPAGVPDDVVGQVQDLLAQMMAGEMDRFDIFTGPIKDNKGEIIVPDGEVLSMGWLAEGIIEDAAIPE